MYTVRIFIKCTHVCAAQTTYLFFIEPDSLITKPRPDIDIKLPPLEQAKSSFIHATLRKAWAKFYFP